MSLERNYIKSQTEQHSNKLPGSLTRCDASQSIKKFHESNNATTIPENNRKTDESLHNSINSHYKQNKVTPTNKDLQKSVTSKHKTIKGSPGKAQRVFNYSSPRNFTGNSLFHNNKSTNSNKINKDKPLYLHENSNKTSHTKQYHQITNKNNKLSHIKNLPSVMDGLSSGEEDDLFKSRSSPLIGQSISDKNKYYSYNNYEYSTEHKSDFENVDNNINNNDVNNFIKTHNLTINKISNVIYKEEEEEEDDEEEDVKNINLSSNPFHNFKLINNLQNYNDNNDEENDNDFIPLSPEEFDKQLMQNDDDDDDDDEEINDNTNDDIDGCNDSKDDEDHHHINNDGDDGGGSYKENIHVNNENKHDDITYNNSNINDGDNSNLNGDNDDKSNGDNNDDGNDDNASDNGTDEQFPNCAISKDVLVNDSVCDNNINVNNNNNNNTTSMDNGKEMIKFYENSSDTANNNNNIEDNKMVMKNDENNISHNDGVITNDNVVAGDNDVILPQKDDDENDDKHDDSAQPLQLTSDNGCKDDDDNGDTNTKDDDLGAIVKKDDDEVEVIDDDVDRQKSHDFIEDDNDNNNDVMGGDCVVVEQKSNHLHNNNNNNMNNNNDNSKINNNNMFTNNNENLINNKNNHAPFIRVGSESMSPDLEPSPIRSQYSNTFSPVIGAVREQVEPIKVHQLNKHNDRKVNNGYNSSDISSCEINFNYSSPLYNNTCQAINIHNNDINNVNDDGIHNSNHNNYNLDSSNHIKHNTTNNNHTTVSDQQYSLSTTPDYNKNKDNSNTLHNNNTSNNDNNLHNNNTSNNDNNLHNNNTSINTNNTNNTTINTNNINLTTSPTNNHSDHTTDVEEAIREIRCSIMKSRNKKLMHNEALKDDDEDVHQPVWVTRTASEGIARTQLLKQHHEEINHNEHTNESKCFIPKEEDENDEDEEEDDDVGDGDDDDPSKNSINNTEYSTDEETQILLKKTTSHTNKHSYKHTLSSDQLEFKKSKAREATLRDPCNETVLIEGVLFRGCYLGSTQLVVDRRPSKNSRMRQAQEAVRRVKAPEGERQPSSEVDLFVSVQKVMVLNTDLQEIIMDHALKTISYIADIGDTLVLMVRRDNIDTSTHHKICCHVFQSHEAHLIAQSIGQAFQVSYKEFLKANGVDDVTNHHADITQQEVYAEELYVFSNKEMQKEVTVVKARGEALGVVVVESGWGSLVPTIVLANMAPSGPAAKCSQLNIGDQIMSVNGVSLVGLPLSTCQTHIKATRGQSSVRLVVVSCPPVVEVFIKRPDINYQLGFSVQNGVICSLLRGGIAEKGGVRVGHRIIEINNHSVVAVPHDKIVSLLSSSVGEIHMKTMPTSIFRLLTGQIVPHYI